MMSDGVKGVVGFGIVYEHYGDPNVTYDIDS